ncbi:glycosyltransferase [Kocuria rhizosphaericola]|uniref:glycosyltransferase n=1 Tax=Kocuria rhizosphaericola TaxID=3376284 RepID=UPI003796753F
MHIDVVPGPGAPGRLPGAEHELQGLLAELALRGVDARPVDPAAGPALAAPVPDRPEPGSPLPERRPEAEALLLVGLGTGAPVDDAQLDHWLERSRAAAGAGRPVVVSGLALGAGAVPERAVRRLLALASLVGLRDETSLAVARRLCPEHPGLRVGRQDALLLPGPVAPARPPERAGPAEQPPGQGGPAAPRIVAAVGRPDGPFPPEEVAPVLAAVLDALVHRTGGTVSLVACGGTSADDEFAADVAALLPDDVRRVPPDDEEGPAALRADWVVTTCPRGAALGMAARAVVLPVAPDKYSLEGMNSVLSGWGLGGGVVPLAALLTPGDVAWDTRAAVQQWAAEAVERRGAVRAALADAEPAVREAADRWWDDVAGALRGRQPPCAPEEVVAPRGVGAPVVRALRRRYTVPEVPPERPTVAVVLRYRDGPARLRRAVDDLLVQTFADWRLVVVNDGGDPAEVDQALAPQQGGLAGRVTVLGHRRALGPAAATNRGVRAADSELVVRHDGNEDWPPTLLQRAVAHLEDPLVTDDGVVVRTEDGPRGGEELPSGRPGRGLVRAGREALTLTDVLDGDRTAADSPFLYRRAVHGVLGDYDETLGAAADWEFTLRFLETFSVGLLPARPPADRERAEGGSAARDELAVRDRRLRQWSAENGIGLPLYLRRAATQEAAALHGRLDAAEELAHELLEVVRAQSRQLDRLERVVAERGFTAFWRRVWRSVRGGRAARPDTTGRQGASHFSS